MSYTNVVASSMIQVGAHIPVTWRTLMNSVQGKSAGPCKPGISFVTIFWYFVKFLEKYDSSVVNVFKNFLSSAKEKYWYKRTAAAKYHMDHTAICLGEFSPNDYKRIINWN
jgi:hypothetical protein